MNEIRNEDRQKSLRLHVDEVLAIKLMQLGVT